ncbi:MAG: purine-nucleoside phosphorylase [Chloroflexi bacterium AL-W]|nr:purine-nucleoside phosphorylase [Chloroflexi bacterium AL-N1]NOK68798.1 purine-nucleoside phosphorylase [Chloroflexi bacterium AL-N10]NOK76284.1 purine-nucleoside phosphorylase [Chloroflexi bacterium AL-N5]NOK84079.1 purine-nucleoside phosphorylase [Chloroflexi bacterium AL-W]NOK91422.1 purine-nucleoside phosphorylase [Chloroflexi bacterium AL-N15]
MTDILTHIEQAHAAIVDKTTVVPRVGLILGSGLGALADDMTDATVIPYTDIPHFPASTVVGHRGELAIGMLADQPVAVLRGRFHFYEGYSMQQVTFPVRVFRALGCDTLFVTNAAGGLHADWNVGDLMLITDQIFLPGMVGQHPLRGPNDERLGTRFPAMVDAFDAELSELTQTMAAEIGITLRRGVYTMLTGPTFESSAELRMLRVWGSDAVGMSTAPEVVVARHAGMRVLGISLITNLALPDGPPANHEEVLEAGELAKPKFSELVKRIVARM